MDINRRYTVTQEREVQVSAVGPVEAIVIANVAFNNTASVVGVDVDIDDKGVKGRTVADVKVRDIHVREDY